MYRACVVNDSDPNAAFLPGVTRQLGFFDDRPIYPERQRTCDVGWNGKLTVTETRR